MLRIATTSSKLPKRSASKRQVRAGAVVNPTPSKTSMFYVMDNIQIRHFTHTHNTSIHNTHHTCSSWTVFAPPISFLEKADSIDYNDPKGAVSWEIDVVLEREVKVPSLVALYEKYLPRLHDFVAAQKLKMTNGGDTSEPILDWVFLRKYAGKGYILIHMHPFTILGSSPHKMLVLYRNTTRQCSSPYTHYGSESLPKLH
jgi:hypothetical protein